ncbi:putative titin [Apostichopus japonicus]|uniref:Putative titin n=1 Tax=Stichopus japonicus TaxID=307972 RepID=A0A2G8LL33_STIJA|nr:putative titin [Apostichopus japonicus]
MVHLLLRAVAATSRTGRICTLEISRATMADTGTYACVAKNTEGEGTTIAELVIVESLSEDDETYNYIRPSFPKGLRRMRVREGRVARIEIRVSGHPTPEVTWMKDGVQIEDEDRISVERAPGGVETLVISGIAPTDAGRYQVMAKSVAGKASVAADLIVVDLEADVDTDDEGDGKRRKRKKRKVPEHEREEVQLARTGEKPTLSTEFLAWKLSKKQRDYSPSTTSEAISVSDLTSIIVHGRRESNT